jgi:hypothetical protein
MRVKIKIKGLCISILLTGLSLSAAIAQQNQSTMENLRKRTTLTCKLTTPELQKRRLTVIAELKNLVKERKEGSDAVHYKFEMNNKNMDLVANFIKSERLCCDFFDFNLEVRSDSEFMWLVLSGPEGVTDFIREEIGF